MALSDRVKNICLTPATEWPVIAAESTTTNELMTGYVLPLAAIPAIAGFIGGSLIGRSLPFIGFYRVSLGAGLAAAVVSFVVSIVSVFIVSWIVNALAPTFSAEKNFVQAMKVTAYSYTPAWVAGILQILPVLGVLAILAGLYGLYLLYLGLPRLMKCPEDKAIGYTVVVVIAAIVVSLVLASITGLIIGAGMLGSGALSGTLGRAGDTSSDVVYDKNSTLGKLQELGKKLDESNKRVEEAQKRGDESAAAGAALEGLGTLLGGGRRVEPVGIDQLKPFVPETFAGLAKQSSNAEKTGLAGLMVSKAEARYGDGAGKSVTLEISDTGGISGMLGLASWIGVQGEKEDDSGIERTQKVGGRLVHEKIAKGGGSNEFGLVLGERFMVSARGSGVSADDLRAAVTSLDLARLESMKDVGVQK
jgi:hypothetical protein